MQYYRRTMPGNQEVLSVEMDRLGTFSAYLLKPNGQTTLLAAMWVSSCGQSGSRESTGLHGETTPALRALGPRFTNSVQHLLRAFISIEKCLSATTPIFNESMHEHIVAN